VDDCLKRQTATATPAKPGGFPCVLKMGGAAGEAETVALRVVFDPRLKLEFRGSNRVHA
jgi:hypothetical protein